MSLRRQAFDRPAALPGRSRVGFALAPPRTPRTMTATRSQLRGLVAVLSLSFLVACSANRLTREEEARQLEIHTETCGSYLNMGEYQRAEDQALRGLAIDEDDFTLNLYLARALLRQGAVDDILKAEHVLSKLPTDEDFRVPLSLGEILERKALAQSEAASGVSSGERYTEAPDPEARATELNEDARRSFERSLQRYREALELQPNDTEVLNGLVRVTALTGQFEDSLAWCEAVVRITESDRLFWRSHLERGNISAREEERIWSNIRKLRDLEQAIRLHAATVLNMELDRPAEAAAELDAILAFYPEIPEVHSQKAQILVKLERYEEAIASIDSYLRLIGHDFDHPDVQRAYRIRGDCEAALVRADN